MSVNRASTRAILVTGGNGFLGSLVTATALMESDGTIVLPVREPYTRERVLAQIAAELAAEGRPARAEDLARVATLPLPPPERIDELLHDLRDLGVRDILHCAGSLSYFNVRKLQAGNLDLTRAVLSLATALDVRRFVYLSTAYSAGFSDRPIFETLHADPCNDPTDYTRTKREAEWMVAGSGLPYVIVRPSTVIGDSRDGRYGGKPYGIYQLWTAGGRYLSSGFPRVLHVVAGNHPVNFLHQDAFKAAFWRAYRTLPDRSVLHLVSRDDALPTMRDLWELWLSVHGGPHEVHFFDRLDDVPIDCNVGRTVPPYIARQTVPSMRLGRWEGEQARGYGRRTAGRQRPGSCTVGQNAAAGVSPLRSDAGRR